MELVTALGSEIQCEKKDKVINLEELLTTLMGKVQYEEHANESYPVDLVIALGSKIPDEEHDKDSENWSSKDEEERLVQIPFVDYNSNEEARNKVGKYVQFKKSLQHDDQNDAHENLAKIVVMVAMMEAM